MIEKAIEEYWSEVGRWMSRRDKEKEMIAGDNDVFYNYKRRIFLQNLKSVVNWNSKKVLEYGCGPAGNLAFLSGLGVNSITGVDISSEMIKLAKENTKEINSIPVELIHNDGVSIPLKNNCMDIVFTSTVLQHNIDDELVDKIAEELCRVSREFVVLCEHTERNRKQLHEHFVGRKLKFYKDALEKQKFNLVSTKYLNIQASYFVLGVIRKVFNPKSRKEGEPLNNVSLGLQKLLHPITKVFDPLIPSKKDLTIMVFKKT